jgi:hypothetical protein
MENDPCIIAGQLLHTRTTRTHGATRYSSGAENLGRIALLLGTTMTPLRSVLEGRSRLRRILTLCTRLRGRRSEQSMGARAPCGVEAGSLNSSQASVQEHICEPGGI